MGLSCFLLLLLSGLHLAILDFLVSVLSHLVSVLTSFSLSSLDLIEGHTNDGLLNFGGLSGTSLGGVINLDLFVELSPGSGPSQFDWLNFLMEQRAGLGSNKVGNSSILSSKANSTSRHDSELSESTSFGFGNHLELMYLYLIMQILTPICA